MTRLTAKTPTKNKKDGSMEITTWKALKNRAKGETTVPLNSNGNHNQDPCKLGLLPNSLNKNRTKIEIKEVKENEVNPDGNEISTLIVTRTGGTVDTGTADSAGDPGGIPLNP